MSGSDVGWNVNGWMDGWDLREWEDGMEVDGWRFVVDGHGYSRGWMNRWID